MIYLYKKFLIENVYMFIKIKKILDGLHIRNWH
nr:MAG TPA: hypothetical protein [Caudoviricetes sp.]